MTNREKALSLARRLVEAGATACDDRQMVRVRPARDGGPSAFIEAHATHATASVVGMAPGDAEALVRALADPSMVLVAVRPEGVEAILGVSLTSLRLPATRDAAAELLADLARAVEMETVS